MNSQDRTLSKKLLVSSFVCAVLVANVSGAHYVYPIFGTSLVDKFHWSSLENSIVGTATFIGSVSSGPLCALLVEKLKFKRTLIIASLTSFLSLLLLSQTYAGHLPSNFILCSMYLVTLGFAGAAAYLCALDSQSHNFKNYKGVSMGITSAALGISGMVFAQINDKFFQSEIRTSTTEFLIFYGSLFFVVTFAASFILGPIDPVQYENEDHIQFINHSQSTYTQSISSFGTSSTRVIDKENDEERPLLFKNVVPSADNISLLKQTPMKQVSGMAFFSDPVGYSLVASLLVMAGLGYVYFTNLGQLLTSLLHDRVSFNEAQHIRNFHVALFSSVNCVSRVVFGSLSDILYRKAGIHRLWFLWVGSIGLVMAMVYLITSVSTADMLVSCTALIASTYGLVFGLTPAIVTEFGDKTFARNWGWLMWAPAVGGQLFNVLFGVVYGQETERQGDSGTCYGSTCYNSTFFIGSLLTVINLLILSFAIYKKRLF